MLVQFQQPAHEGYARSVYTWVE